MDCSSLTTLLKDLDRHNKQIDQFLDTDRPEQALEKVDIIDQMIWEKREFLLFRKVELLRKIMIDAEELTKQGTKYLRGGFWPVQLAGANKENIVFMSSLQNVVISDLRGSGYSLNLSNDGLPGKLNGYFWADRNGGVFVCASGSAGPRIEYVKYGTGTLRTGITPEIFSGDDSDTIMVGVYPDGKLCKIGPQFSRGEEFAAPQGRKVQEIKKVMVSSSGKYTYTLSSRQKLEQWDNESKTWVKTVLYNALDVRVMSGDRLVCLSAGKIFYIDSDQITTNPPVIDSGRVNGYWEIAVDPSEEYLYALNGVGGVDVFKIGSFEKVTQINLEKYIGTNTGHTVKFFDVGKDDKIVIGLNDGQVLILGRNKI